MTVGNARMTRSMLSRLRGRIETTDAAGITPILQHHLDHVGGGECGPHESGCSHASECDPGGHNSQTTCEASISP